MEERKRVVNLPTFFSPPFSSIALLLLLLVLTSRNILHYFSGQRVAKGKVDTCIHAQARTNTENRIVELC